MWALFRLIAAPSVVTSVVLAIGWLSSGTLGSFAVVFWGKLFTTALVLFYVFTFQRQTFYFFHLLGYTRSQLIVLLFIADALLAVVAFGIVFMLL